MCEGLSILKLKQQLEGLKCACDIALKCCMHAHAEKEREREGSQVQARMWHLLFKKEHEGETQGGTFMQN